MTPSPRRDDLQSLIRFGSVVDGLVQHIEAARMKNHLNNPTLLHDVVHKLPTEYQLKWAEYKLKQRKEDDLGMFGCFMNHLLDLVFEIVDDKTVTGRGHVNVHNNNTQIWSQRTCALCNGGGHGVSTCATFRSLTNNERWRRVNNLSFCRMCLNKHSNYPCRSFSECEISGCRLPHHTLLHRTNLIDDQQNNESSRQTTSNSGYCSTHSNIGRTSLSIFRIIPITLEKSGHTVSIYALLDEGSDLTLLDEEIAQQMQISETQHELKMMWTRQVARTERYSMKINSLTIYGKQKKKIPS